MRVRVGCGEGVRGAYDEGVKGKCGEGGFLVNTLNLNQVN